MSPPCNAHALLELLQAWPPVPTPAVVDARVLADRWSRITTAVDGLATWLARAADDPDGRADAPDRALAPHVRATLLDTLAGLDTAFGRSLIAQLPVTCFRPIPSSLALLADSSPQALLEEMAILAWLDVPSLIRSPRSWSWLAHAFLQNLRASETAASMHIVSWDRSDRATLERAVSMSHLVRVWGRRATWRAVQEAALSTHATLQFFGPRISLAVVAHGDTWSALARDVRVLEQRGCFSPQWVFLTGDAARDPGHSLEALASALEEEHAHTPRPPRDPGVAAEVLALRTQVEFGQGLVRHGPWGDALLVVDPPGCLPGPGERVVQMTLLPEDTHRLAGLCRPFRGMLSSVATDTPLSPAILGVFRDAGAWRFCRPGQLQAGVPSPVHDGRSRLEGLLCLERWD